MRRPSRACSGTGQTASGTYAPPPAGLCSSALTVTSVHPAHLPFLLPPLYTRCRPVTRGEIPSKRRGQSGPASDCQKTLLGGLEGPQTRNLNRRGGRWPRPPLVSVDSSGSLWPLRSQVSRLLNHSHFPDGRAHGFAAPLRVALPPSVATAHRAGASLRATGHTLPSVPSE